MLWGISNEYSQHMFLWRIEANYPRIIAKYSSLTPSPAEPWYTLPLQTV